MICVCVYTTTVYTYSNSKYQISDHKFFLQGFNKSNEMSSESYKRLYYIEMQAVTHVLIYKIPAQLRNNAGLNTTEVCIIVYN